MVTIVDNISLQPLHTFGLPAVAAKFVQIDHQNELEEIISKGMVLQGKHIVLGEGSNIIFPEYYNGLVLRMATRGIHIIKQSEREVELHVESGEPWDGFVSWCCDNNFWGLENLSGIPGTVGACPIQNIGAYGSEVCHSIIRVHYYDIASGEKRSIEKEDCHFGYRHSIFKQELKDKVIIAGVDFGLSCLPKPIINYGELKQHFSNWEVGSIGILEIRNKVLEIRAAKIPDHKLYGSAGSFFKNPVVAKVTADALLQNHPEMPTYPVEKKDNACIKLSAAWLIDQAGCKGKTVGGAQCNVSQPLILINLGGATRDDVLLLSAQIASAVFKKFGVSLIPEVNIYSD
jgi:UDP-N-acetylmuramate dehydrogenase